MARFCLDHSPGSQPVKAAVVAHYKLCNAVLCNVLLHRLPKRRQDPLVGFPVANKKQVFIVHLLYNI